MPQPGSIITLEIEKATAGGRMLARHNGQIVLVWGGIPGERVDARIERAGKGVLYADTAQVVTASGDRRAAFADWRCGGAVFAHVAYERQLRLKGEILQDAFGRIGRAPLATAPEVIASPERGYRMRARLHAHGDRLGFYREGTHQLCDAAATGQLLPATQDWIVEAQATLARTGLSGLAAIEIAENIAGDERVCHLELHAGTESAPFAALGGSLTGLSAQPADRSGIVRLGGTTTIADVLHASTASDAPGFRLERDVRAFFQGNRFLLERLLHYVVALVPPGPVVDLYAGVGLFGLALAARGTEAVTAVEGDPVSSADLQRNAEPFQERVTIERRSVESFLAAAGRRRIPADATFVVDPPRTGMSKDALAGTIRRAPARMVYVSCDVATLARDARVLRDAGYDLQEMTAFDLFPNTAHVETVAVFSRGQAAPRASGPAAN